SERTFFSYQHRHSWSFTTIKRSNLRSYHNRPIYKVDGSNPNAKHVNRNSRQKSHFRLDVQIWYYQFTSELFRDLNQMLGINHFISSSYHPQANGSIGNWHRTESSNHMPPIGWINYP